MSEVREQLRRPWALRGPDSRADMRRPRSQAIEGAFFQFHCFLFKLTSSTRAESASCEEEEVAGGRREANAESNARWLTVPWAPIELVLLLLLAFCVCWIHCIFECRGWSLEYTCCFILLLIIAHYDGIISGILGAVASPNPRQYCSSFCVPIITSRSSSGIIVLQCMQRIQ